MTTNRFDDIAAGEHAAVEVLLEQLAKAHGSESRAADVVAAESLRDRFRYAPGLGWMEWDGRRWDTGDEADERVGQHVREFMDAKERDYRARATTAATGADLIATTILARVQGEIPDSPKDRRALVEANATEAEAKEYNARLQEAADAKRQGDIWLNLLSRAKIRAITDLCRATDGILTRTADLDQHPDLLNCTNCIVDLRTGEARPHDPQLLITKIAGGAYIPGARSALWDQVQEAIHPDAREWFRKRIGQAFTGHTPNEDSIVVSAGGGENGKTAVMAACMQAAGEYGRLISHKVLISTPGAHSTELMDLRGLRLALLEETPEEGRLDTQQLKTTIGAEYITARHMRQNDITFRPTHSLFINTNFVPQVDTTDHGTWRRLYAMPWPFTFRKPWEECTEPNHRPGDPTLKKRIRTDDGALAAVIAWAVAGAVHYYRDEDNHGNRAPACVEEATRTWRLSSDVGLQFASEYLVAAPGHFIAAEAMFTEFTEFLQAEGKRPWSKQTVNVRLPESMKSAGIVVSKTPVDKPKVTQAMKQSHPPQLSRVDATGWPVRPDTARVDIPAGRTCRMWLGVRFRTEAERGQSLAEAI